MTNDQHLVSEGWADYELLDSGDGEKLERFGTVMLARPETQALWGKRRPELWRDIHADFRSEDGKGAWYIKKEVPESWGMSWGPIRFSARLTAFKHVGVFPEQEPNWVWVAERVGAMSQRLGTVSEGARNRSHTLSVLNLFGYTGIASIAAAQAGACVTHVDAAKTALDWAHEDARLSGLSEDAIRWILDDALAFAKRELRRGAKYDGIILDPPAFGRGPRGEVWHIEHDLPTLLSTLKELLADVPDTFFLVSGYAAGYAPRSLVQAVESAFGPTKGKSGELHIKEAAGDRIVPSGIYARFVR